MLGAGYDDLRPVRPAIQASPVALGGELGERPAAFVPVGSYPGPQLAQQLDVLAPQASRPAQPVQAPQEHEAVGPVLGGEPQFLRAVRRGSGDPLQQSASVQAADEARLVRQHELLAEVGHTVGPKGSHALAQAVGVRVEGLERRMAGAELVLVRGKEDPGELHGERRSDGYVREVSLRPLLDQLHSCLTI